VQAAQEANMPSRGSSILPVFTLALIALAGPARPDTLVLQDGRRVQGQLVSVSRGWVEFQPIEGESAADRLRLAVAEVRAIQFDDGRDVASSSAPARNTTFEVGGGADRADAPADTAIGDERPRRARRGARDRDAAGTGTLPASDDGIVRARDGGTRATSGRRGRMITVSTAERWTDTGIDVTSGDVVSFSIAGTVSLGDDRSLGAEGDLDGVARAPRRPMPDRPAGALIGRIGTSPDDTFFIGAERLPFRVRTSGRLYLGVNDDTLDDDDGAFQVAVTR
jgi:hypothetical protein